MFKRFFKWLSGEPLNTSTPTVRKPSGLFSTQGEAAYADRRCRLDELLNWPVPRPSSVGIGMDANDAEDGLKPAYGGINTGIPDAQVYWYASQGFIGYQMCALLSQNWLIEKACSMPAKDAVRNGYDISVDDGTEVDAKVIDYIRKIDRQLKLNQQMIEFVRMGRIFGIRIAKFVVESGDPRYYEQPFNIDGVAPGTYKGISQIDPYWIVPELTSQATLQPGSQHFYEPEFWRIGDFRIHRSHLVIYTTGSVPDVLKPAYYFGGVSITQRIYERVYAAERTANEAPMLAMTKRLTVMKTDLEEAVSNEEKFNERMNWWIQNRDNYGVKFVGSDDELQQFDLSLTDLDNIIMTQYQLVAAIAEVPGTKLLGTQPKGFNSTGEFEESSYHETLESIQTNDIQPLLDRHYDLVVKSFVMPKFGLPMFKIDVAWNELDAMTATERAGVNLQLAELDNVLLQTGAIDSQVILNRLINDPDSGYSGLSAELPPMPDQLPTGGAGSPLAPLPKPKLPIPKAAPGA